MPIGDFEREILRVLSAQRNPDSFIGGATVLLQAPYSTRQSQDVDVFHDLPEALVTAYEADVRALRAAGFHVEPIGRVQPEFRRAVVRRGGLETKIEWVQDSAFRFFPVEPDLDLGWRLSFWDAATNKVLAVAGRQRLRDCLDCLFLDRHHLKLGALAWAAAGKDPGLTPELILDWAMRGNRFRQEDLADVHVGEPIDLVRTKQAWGEAVQGARELVERLPPAEVGCFYLDAKGRPVCPDPGSTDFDKLTRHSGCVKGAWPRIVEG
jgi:hypothetical protein